MGMRRGIKKKKKIEKGEKKRGGEKDMWAGVKWEKFFKVLDNE